MRQRHGDLTPISAGIANFLDGLETASKLEKLASEQHRVNIAVLNLCRAVDAALCQMEALEQRIEMLEDELAGRAD